jgi:hypothetical protein
VTIDPKSLSFGEVRQVLSELEAAKRELGGFSAVLSEEVVDPFVTAAKEMGIDVAEFPRLIGRQPVADPMIAATGPRKGKIGRGHPFERGNSEKLSFGNTAT